MNDAEQMVRDAVAKLVAQQQSGERQKMVAFESLLNEISAALGDVVAAMESGKGSDDAIAKALTAGLKNLRVDVKVAAPNVTFNVEPTPVHNHFAVPPSAPAVVHIIPAEKGRVVHVLEITQYLPGGFPSQMTITRKEG